MSTEEFLHGIEVVQLNDGIRPIKTRRSAVIGVIGTAPGADNAVFPLNVPVLVLADRVKAAKLGLTGTLPLAMKGIFDQVGAVVVVLRVAASDDVGTALANVIGGVSTTTGKRTGLPAFFESQARLGVSPKILIAPGFTQNKAIVDYMAVIANRLRAMVIKDGPSTTDSAAIAARNQYGSKRVVMYDPDIYSFDTVIGGDISSPSSAHIAGAWARNDAERGFHFSPSNFEVFGITGFDRSIDYQFGERDCSANFLNSNCVNTIIKDQGNRLWGNSTCSGDPLWQPIKRVRVSDMINESIQYAHKWAVDQNVTKNFVEAVVEGVNLYLRHLSSPHVGVLMPGAKCWADKYYNTYDQLAQGNVRFDFDWCEPATAEHITMASHWNGTLLEEAFA
ncbi:Putative prophage major tail sheath protein [Ephemeroptericola cinctiostellae]|uniref:Prophage major tail sheath protein n=1 Tax=Ephemeroptericola cinctiostellae TaxID=2268024 RepID=A0A345DE55_9BURK|nr:phage tail sheath subtilisin-like domain-containing protein [Ephemeroptericola cinctiostellae]AXF86643.1 Putative prophage major tail sheath protein [Ephemeroptericola cinctiostellae]